MRKNTALRLFGGLKETAAALNISYQAVYQWTDPLTPKVISRIITVLMQKGRQDEASELLKKHLNG